MQTPTQETAGSRAVAQMEAVAAFEDALQTEFTKPNHDRDHAKISALLQRINRATKAAHVWATLAVAEAVNGRG